MFCLTIRGFCQLTDIVSNKQGGSIPSWFLLSVTVMLLDASLNKSSIDLVLTASLFSLRKLIPPTLEKHKFLSKKTNGNSRFELIKTFLSKSLSISAFSDIVLLDVAICVH